MSKLIKLLTFLRLVDPHDGNVSLTNVGLMVAIGKLVVAPAGPIDLAVLLGTLLAYHAKRLVGVKVAGTAEAVTEAKDAAVAASRAATEAAEAAKSADLKVDTLSSSVRLAGMAGSKR